MQSVNLSSPIRWDAPLNRGLLRWWLCLPNQNRGNVWRELTRRSDATISGATAAGARGRQGGWGCYEYDGTNDYLQTTAINLSSISTMTLSLWFWWDTNANDNDALMESSPDNSAGNSGSIGIIPNHSGGAFRIAVGTPSFSSSTIVRPSAAVWHHGVFGFDRNAGTQQVVSAYIDGISRSLTPVGTASTSTGGFGNWQWQFFSRGGSSLFGAGKLDDIRIYNRVLSASEALELYRASKAGYRNELRWLTPAPYFPEEIAVASGGYVPRNPKFRNRTLARM